MNPYLNSIYRTSIVFMIVVLIISCLSACVSSPYHSASTNDFNLEMAYERSIDTNTFELAHLLSSKQISGTGGEAGKSFGTCEGIVDAYVSISNEITLKVRTGGIRSNSKNPGDTLRSNITPEADGIKKITICIQANSLVNDGKTGYYIKTVTISNHNWGLSEWTGGMIRSEKVPATIRKRIVDSWWSEYEKMKTNFILSTENGSITTAEAEKFLYTYRGFSKKSILKTEEIIADCISYGKNDIAKMMVNQIIESGGSVSPQIVAELKRRGVR